MLRNPRLCGLLTFYGNMCMLFYFALLQVTHAVSLLSPPSQIRNSSNCFQDQITGTNTIELNFLVDTFELMRTCFI